MSSIDLITANPDENSPSTIAAQIDLFVTQLKASIPQFNTVFGEVNTLAANAQAAAGALATLAWVSGTSYSIGDVRYSPVNYMSYRRKTNGAGTTDPSSDTTNWALLNRPTAGGALETSSAANITLTENSVRFQHIKMTASSKSVTLPNPSLLEEGSPLFVIRNSGTSGQNDYKFFIKDHNGNMIARADLGTTIVLNLVDSTWSVMADSRAAKAPLCYTTTVVNSVAATASKAVMLDSTTALILYFDTTAKAKVITVNSAGSITAGSPVNITAPINTVYDIVALSATEVICAYRTAANNSAAVVLTISGTTVTVGASPATIDAGNAVTAIALTPISSTRAIVSYYRTTGAGVYSRVLDVAASVVTAGAESTGVSAYSTPGISTVYIDSTHILMAYRNAINTANAVVLTISGAAISEGTPLQVATNGGGLSLNTLSIELLNSSKGVVFFDYNETAVNKDLGFAIFDISGATLSNTKVRCLKGVGVIGKIVVTRLSDYRLLLTFKDETLQASSTQLGDIMSMILRYDNEFLNVEAMAPLTKYYSQTNDYDYALLSSNRMLVLKTDSSTSYAACVAADIPQF